MQGYVQGTLRKNKLIASFVEHLKENHENITSVYFQFYIAKSYSVYYMGLYTGCSTKDAIDSLFFRSL